FTDGILVTSGGRREATLRGAGLALIAVGIVLMAFDSLADARPRQLLGDGFLLLASLSWSLYGVTSRRLGLPPAHSAAIVAVFSMVIFVPLYALLPGKALLAASARDLALQAAFQGV